MKVNSKNINDKSIKELLMYLTKDDINTTSLDLTLDNLFQYDKEVIYKELEKLSNIQLISIKSSITAFPRDKKYPEIKEFDITTTAIVSAFVSATFTMFSMFTLDILFGVSMILLACFFIRLNRSTIKLKRTKTRTDIKGINLSMLKMKVLIPNFIDDILAKRNDDMEVKSIKINEVKKIDKKKKSNKKRNKKK